CTVLHTSPAREGHRPLTGHSRRRVPHLQTLERGHHRVYGAHTGGTGAERPRDADLLRSDGGGTAGAGRRGSDYRAGGSRGGRRVAGGVGDLELLHAVTRGWE